MQQFVMMRRRLLCSSHRLNSGQKLFHACYFRSFSTTTPPFHEDQHQSQQTGEMSIKSKIMQIYKKTHPDLFENYPKNVQLTNQKSLQKLNNFIDEYKGYEPTGNTLHNVAGLHVGANKYHLEFYVKQQKQAAEQQQQENGELSEKDLLFIKVTLTGPPAESGIVAKSKAMSINFSKLFRAMLITLPGSQPEEEEVQPDFIDDENLDEKAKELLSETFAFMGKDLQFQTAQYSEHGAHNIAAFVLKQLHSKHRSGDQKVTIRSSDSEIEELVLKRQAEIETQLLRHKISDFLCAEAIRFDSILFSPEKQLACLTKWKDILHFQYGVNTEYWGQKELNFERVRQQEFIDYSEVTDPNLIKYRMQNAETYRISREKLNSLRKKLNERRDRMPGLVRIIFCKGSRSYISELGHVALGIDQAAEEWMYFLMNECNYEDLEKYVLHKNRILRLEKEACAILGVKSIISENDNVFIDDKYQQLLQELVAGRRHRTEYSKHLRIIICEEPESGIPIAKVHPTFGFMLCPLTSSEQLCEWIDLFGKQAAETSTSFFHDRDQVNRIIGETRRYLQLEFLDYVQTLNPKAVIACCHKMIRSANILKPILKGLNVCISDGFYWRESDGVFELPVDF